MNDSMFPIYVAEIPPMIGRENTMLQLCNKLTKRTPSHLSVVGPRFAGKSVLLNTLADRMRENDYYCAVIPWDLRHKTHKSNEDFMKDLCQLLGKHIRPVDEVLGDALLSVKSGVFSEICEVLDLMDDHDQKLLMLWDGLDRTLSNEDLTRDLWDNLLELCRKPNFRLVTSTRKELHQLIQDENTKTSDFWGIFEVVKITPFDDNDIDSILEKRPKWEFSAGAKTELINWSGGFPPLFLSILNEIFRTTSGPVDNKIVNAAAGKAIEERHQILDDLWDDCSDGAKDIYIKLTEDDLLFSETKKEERDCLIEKGFARKSGNKLTDSCRMLKKYINDVKKVDNNRIAELFGSWDDYQSNIRGVLESRFAQISCFHERLHRLVKQSIQDVPRNLEDCLRSLSIIRDLALELIWEREFGPTGLVPDDVKEYWTHHDRSSNKLIDKMMRIKSWKIPDTPLDQIRLLGLLTGSYNNFSKVAKFTSKDTYVLIDLIHGFRNRAEHKGDQNVGLGAAVTALMACIELCACLEREQPQTQ